MKKLFLVCLMLLAGSAWAGWVLFDSDDETRFFYDPTTIRKDGNLRRVWELMDHKKRRDNGAMSYRFRSEFDCKQERYRFLGFTSFPEPKAGGTALKVWGEQFDWTSIAPDTNAEMMLNIVCAK